MPTTKIPQKTTYKFKLRVPLGKLLEPIQEIEDQINDTMNRMNEKSLMITSLLELDITSSNKLKAAEIKKLTETVLEVYTEKLGYAELISINEVK